MTAPQLTESLSDRLTALKCPLPDGLIARARTGAEAFSPPAVRTARPRRGHRSYELTSAAANLRSCGPSSPSQGSQSIGGDSRHRGCRGGGRNVWARAQRPRPLDGTSAGSRWQSCANEHSQADAFQPCGEFVANRREGADPADLRDRNRDPSDRDPGSKRGIWIAYSCSSNTMPFNSIFVSGRGVPVFLGPNFEFWLHQFSTPNRCSGTLPTDGGQGGPLTVRFNAVRPSVTWTVALYEYPSQAILSAPSPWETAPSFPGSTPPFLDAPAPRGGKSADQDHLWLGVGNTSDRHGRTQCAARHRGRLHLDERFSERAHDWVRRPSLRWFRGDRPMLLRHKCRWRRWRPRRLGRRRSADASSCGRSLCEVGHPRLRRGWIYVVVGAAGLAVHST